ncbi:hypothetical protein KC19_4G186500 [Ceratodon purpureus]|uniref:Uncharacterized protein n=1 Tax=Ceratodon purpureus TaxID=3225 RepID=A0A8T0IA34_CERPU|nr:hypothetical protein KC19_4G186500 [Ceratodon purpureus]
MASAVASAHKHHHDSYVVDQLISHGHGNDLRSSNSLKSSFNGHDIVNSLKSSFSGHDSGHGHGLKSFNGYDNDNGQGLKSSNGHANGHGQSLSPNKSGHIDFGSGHFEWHMDQEIRCSRCSCLPDDCHCVESHAVGHGYSHPDPDEVDHPREYETHVQIVRRVPQMREVEEKHYRKDAIYVKQKVSVPKSHKTYDEVEHFEMVPRVRMVTKTRPEIEYVEYTEEIEIPEIVQEVEYEEVCVVRQEQRVIPEWVEETIQVPIVKEVKVTKMCEEFTGRYIETEVEKFVSPGNFGLICEDSCHQHSSAHGKIRKSRSSASSVSGGDSPSHHHSTSKPKKNPSMTEKDYKAAALKAMQSPLEY